MRIYATFKCNSLTFFLGWIEDTFTRWAHFKNRGYGRNDVRSLIKFIYTKDMKIMWPLKIQEVGFHYILTRNNRIIVWEPLISLAPSYNSNRADCIYAKICKCKLAIFTVLWRSNLPDTKHAKTYSDLHQAYTPAHACGRFQFNSCSLVIVYTLL